MTVKTELTRNEMTLAQKLDLLKKAVSETEEIVNYLIERDALMITSDKSRDFVSDPYFVKNVGAMDKINCKGRENTKISAVRDELKKLSESNDRIDQIVAERALAIIDKHTTISKDYPRYDLRPDAEFEEVNKAQLSTLFDNFMPTLKAEKRAKVLKKIVEEKAMAKIKAKRQVL